jgi:putative transposase
LTISAPSHAQPDQFLGPSSDLLLRRQAKGDGEPERFNRALKEQIIHGWVYRNIYELRDAVRHFVGRYNAQWMVEKNGFLSPERATEKWNAVRPIRPVA